MTEEDREEGFIDWADLSKRMKKEKKEGEMKNNPKVELPDCCGGCLVTVGFFVAILILPMFFFMIGFPLMGFAACVLVACVIFKPIDRMICGKKDDDDDD